MWMWKKGRPPDEGASSSNSNPPDGIRKISDAVYALCEPEGPPEIEIVFIHGLQLSDYDEAYWRAWIAGVKQEDGREICWPMTWLGEEFPRARILSLKYDSCVLRTNITGMMDGFLLGESLVQEMVGMANIGQYKNCPVVFVCHCVGGLVAKEIIIKAHRKFGNEAKYVNFLENIRGFHFYATPHEGSKLSDLAVLLPYMGEMVDLVRVINKELGRLNNDFECIERDHYTNKWQFSVVAETHITRFHGFSAMVVEETSARHGYRNFLSVPADHFGVCKPSDKASSSSYLSLKNFIAEVVADNKRRKDDIFELPPFVVGKESRVKEVSEKLEGHFVVALVGMGGVGKTTLSKCVFNAQRDNFERYCFLEDVKSRGSIECCQKELFHGLCGGRWDESKGVNFHLREIKECIMSQKVLLVVDDVGDGENMRALQVDAFNDGKSGSKVILTSRRRDIYVNQEMIMDVDFLSEDQALELFSYYAFSGVAECVRVQFDDQAKKITKACGKLPLSLEVIGQFLRSKWKDKSCESMEQQMKVWDDALRRLKEAKPFDGSSDDKKLWARLKISYDDLDKDEQTMFLDMACILCRCSSTNYGTSKVKMLSVDMGCLRYSCSSTNSRTWKVEMFCRNTLEWIWNSPIGIQNLTNRSLIKWNWNGDGNLLVIHDQLQDMACRIVADEVDGNKSRVWDFDDGVQFMRQKRVSKILEGLFLHGNDESWSTSEELKNYFIGRFNQHPIDCFDHLRLLNLSGCGGKVVRYYIGLSTKNLKWVSLHGSAITKSNIKGMKFLSGLRVLSMQGCNSLKTLPASIGNLSLLVIFDLSFCTKLKSLPRSIGRLQQLRVLNLSWCESLETLPTSIGYLSILTELNLNCCISLEALPTSIGNLSLLTVLDLSGCAKLKSLPESIGRLQQLQVLKNFSFENLKSSLP